jgi:hypothetical protein
MGMTGFGIMPLQLLNLGVLIPRMILRIFKTRTPRGKPSFVSSSQILTVGRFCGVKCPSDDQLRCCIPSSDSRFRGHHPVQRRPAIDCCLWCHLLWSGLRGVQVQVTVW